LGILGFVLMLLLGEITRLGLTWWRCSYPPVKTCVIPLPAERIPNPPCSAVRHARHVAMGLLLAVIILESLVLFASEFYLPARSWLEANLWLLLGSLLALTLAAVGVGVGLRRLALYGGLAIILTLLQYYFDLPVYFPYLALGLICGLAGTVLLTRYLRRFPLSGSVIPIIALSNQKSSLLRNQAASDYTNSQAN
jgi:hypothetical protein